MSKKMNYDALRDVMQGAEVTENKPAPATTTFEYQKDEDGDERINGRKVSQNVTVTFLARQLRELKSYANERGMKVSQVIKQALIEKGAIKP